MHAHRIDSPGSRNVSDVDRRRCVVDDFDLHAWPVERRSLYRGERSRLSSTPWPVRRDHHRPQRPLLGGRLGDLYIDMIMLRQALAPRPRATAPNQHLSHFREIGMTRSRGSRPEAPRTRPRSRPGRERPPSSADRLTSNDTRPGIKRRKLERDFDHRVPVDSVDRARATDRWRSRTPDRPGRC